MELNETLFSLTLTVIIAFLIVVGTYLVLTIEELRRTIKRVNSILDGFEKVGINIEHGISGFMGFASGVKSFLKVVESAGRKKASHKK